jgi:hypothetical protein
MLLMFCRPNFGFASGKSLSSRSAENLFQHALPCQSTVAALCLEGRASIGTHHCPSKMLKLEPAAKKIDRPSPIT